MRYDIKRQILRMTETLLEAHKGIELLLKGKEFEKANTVLSDCQDCAVVIGETIEKLSENQESIIRKLEEYHEQLYLINSEMRNLTAQEAGKTLDRYVMEIKEQIEKTIIAKRRIVFMPYKAAMWTSLESIWKEAQKDSDCEVKVVVIPYFNLDHNMRKNDLVYEAALFPKEVPIVPYWDYELEQEQPDIIFIHNPYDNTNNVTRVPERYYSYNLKRYTETLVYSPYGMMGYYNSDLGHFMCMTNAVQIADYTLVQSEKVKEIYISQGAERDKLIALGSPKVDAIVNGLKEPIVYPEGWEKKLKGRKVFLLNTHLSDFIKGYLYEIKEPGRQNYAVWNHDNCCNLLLNREGCALIWRPHPLLKTTLKSRGLFELLEYVENLEQRIEAADNGVVDRSGEYLTSFKLSDALVTTYSSIISEYMITEKPVYIYQHRLKEECRHNSPVDYSNLYYRARPGEEAQFPLFVQMILNNEDPLREKRLQDLHRAFSNLDGTIGKNIYHLLKQ